MTGGTLSSPLVPRLQYRLTRRDDIAAGLSMLPAWLGLDDATLAALPSLWQRLVDEPAIYSMVMEDVARRAPERIQAWGVALLAPPGWVDVLGLEGPPSPFVVRRIYTGLLDGRLVLPDDEELGRLHARGELSFIAMHWGMRHPSVDDAYGTALISIGNESMRFGMSGHNLRAIYYENEAAAEAWMAAAGFVARGESAPGLHWWGMTREEAQATTPGSTARHLFVFQPPRFRLSLTQRRLLWQAMFGEDDEQLAQAVGTSAHGLKKLWRGIYERIEATEPEFFGDAAGADDGKRGPEKRRQVLAYVRQRTEEMRPWVAG